MRTTSIWAVVAPLLLVSALTSVSTMAQDDDNIVILATTTSTDNSGLLDYILPEIEKDTGFDYRTIAVGTGKALQIGRAD